MHSQQLKNDRLDYDIVQERITLNFKEKSIKNNLNGIKEKYLNVQKENKLLLNNISELTNENNKLNANIERLKIDIENNIQM